MYVQYTYSDENYLFKCGDNKFVQNNVKTKWARGERWFI